MRHAQGGLLKHEALGRGEDVGAPRERLSSQRQVVELGVEPAQAETEASFPLGRAVARTLVASPARERRDNLRPEVDRRLLTHRRPLGAGALKREGDDRAREYRRDDE